MDKFQIPPWLKNIRRQYKIDVPSHKMENAIESAAQRIKVIGTDTENQWQRMNVVLGRKHNLSTIRNSSFEKGKFRLAISSAVALALVFIFGLIVMRQYSPKIYETTRGQHSTVILKDSTEIILNSMSELTVNRWALEKTRQVALKGEALFHVKKNGTPFIINTDIGIIQVLGTKFNVRMRDDRMDVAVLEGRVQISVRRNGKDSTVILSVGQIAVCAKNDFPGTPAPLPFVEYPGWVHGKFLLYRSTLLSACEEIESQFDITIKIERSQLQNETITGIVDGQNIESALLTLTQLTGNKYKHENNSYVVY